MRVQSLYKFAFASLMAASMLLSGCSDKDEKKDPKKKLNGSEIVGRNPSKAGAMTVTDLQGNPVPNAQILIGEAVSQDPANVNFFEADVDGSFDAPVSWVAAESVTIWAPGYVRATYLGQTPTGQKFGMRKIDISGNFELKGQGTGFKIKDKDNKVDFALMMPTMTRDDLFSFNLNSLISREVDQIEIYGQKAFVPSNIALPKQKENYGIIPVTIEKPAYRLYFGDQGTQTVLTLKGQFPFKEVLKEMQNQTPFANLVNYFSLQGGSIKSANISGPKQVMDLPVNEMVFDQKRNMIAPVISADDFVVAVPVSEFQGTLYPTDIKNLTSGQKISLTTAAGAQPELLVARKMLSEQNIIGGGHLSAALVPFTENVQPELLPMMDNPDVVSETEVKIHIPASGNINEVGMYSVLSRIIVDQQGMEDQIRLWEVYAPKWISGFKLPQWPNVPVIPGNKRWAVSLTGTMNNKVIDLDARMLKNISHATYSATNF